MNKNLLFAAIAVVLLNCQNPKAENPPPAPTEVAVTGDPENPVQTATNSIDYLGIYKGTLPCADCAGIDTSIELSEDFSFTMVTKYKGKGAKPIETKGTFRWNANGNTITLNNGADLIQQYLVTENTLTKLDSDGKKIEGKLADQYILKKVTDAAAEKLPVPQQEQSTQDIVGVKWKLIELNGQPIQQQGDKPLHIELDPMNAFTGFAGCNTLRGHYETRDNRIRFMRIMGTMKGCAQLPIEEKFKAMLGAADNFVRNGKILQFRDGENFIAKFEAIAK
jgi:copper homeostasis protein (lipoprotein)